VINREKNQRVISGFRPTSDLTLGNYFGAIRPALDIQEDETKDLTVFVADMHGLTDHHPTEIAPYRKDVMRDCLAAGIDPDKTTLYIQSDIEEPLVQIANRVAPYVSVGELLRTPNLKEKMQAAKAGEDDSLNANLSLLSYPVLMAADIYSQQAPLVAVGKDQQPHLEISRKIARRFNNAFGRNVLVEPQSLALRSIHILALNGKGKMSKTNPTQAIMLNDDPEYARQKVQKATTAQAGSWNDLLRSHFMIADGFADELESAKLMHVKRDHTEGRPVMGQFKKIWGDIIVRTLAEFQEKRDAITEDEVDAAIAKGEQKAYVSAERVLDSMKDVMGV